MIKAVLGVAFFCFTGVGIDMGASFIHDANDNNPIVQLHKQFNLPMLDSDYSGWLVVRENDSVPYNAARVEAASDRVSKVRVERRVLTCITRD